MKEALRLLSRREKVEVLGKNKSNLWLLSIVIVVTFLSIAFSNGSVYFLNDKMNDPFTNWVDIYYGKMAAKGLKDSLESDYTKERFKIISFQADYLDVFMYFVNPETTDSLDAVHLRGRFMHNISNELTKAILSSDNLVAENSIKFEDLTPRTIGAIVTADALKALNYDPLDPPAFILKAEHSPGADTLGLDMFDNKMFAPLPTAVLAVVKKLPSKYDYLSTEFFYNNTKRQPTFSMGNPEYARQLVYYVNEDKVDDFAASLKGFMPDSLKEVFKWYEEEDAELNYNKPMREGKFISVYPFGFRDSEELAPYIDIAARIKEHWPQDVAMRTGRYRYAEEMPEEAIDYLSVYFERLDQIKDFEKYMTNVHGTKIDMEQVNSKENFNAVSVMANILSAAMIIFSIVCIVLFIVNMLQSYFQKVKKNMGTFKAFGISTKELLVVYVRMLLGIILTAIGIALAVSWGVELLLNALGVMKEGHYPYLILWNVKTIASILIMVVSSVITVYVVMNKLMRHTPGDLIYDR